MPRIDTRAQSAFSIVKYNNLNHRCMKWMRSIRSSGIG
jgi:hypothetical protein